MLVRIPVSKEDPGPTNAKQELNLEEIARLQLGETPETKAESLLRLRQLLEGEPTLKYPESDDFLVMFLRARKYRVEDAFKMIKNYFRMRRDMPEFFDGLVPENVSFRTVCHDQKLLMISPEPGEYGRSIAVVNIGAWNPEVCSLLDITRAVLLLTSSWLHEDNPTICGVAGVVDLKGLSIRHLTHITPSYLVKVIRITQDCWPVRIKAMYIINHPKVFEIIFAAVKPFLRSKLLSRPTRIPAAKEDAGPTAEAKPELNLEEIARLQLGETPETKAESLLQLRQLLAREATLKIPTSDDFLVMFLRARKYRVEDAFKMVKKYFRVRRDMPEFFDNLVIENVPFRKVCHEHKLLLISPEPGEYGRCMVFFNIALPSYIM
ncbi:hypothetical protein MTO96_032230 [Rhipicephalus appendiculatus]